MKKNRPAILLLAVLLAVTAAAAGIHLSTRQTAQMGTVLVEYGGKVEELSLDRVELTAVRGTVINGKGEERRVDAQGAPLSAVLAEAGITSYTQAAVTADDEYSVTVTQEEATAPDRVFLIVQEGERPQLLVFGDPNSKRNVTNVIRLTVS
ncbi:MAG: hypothetical protein HFF29_06810 [Oscillospiraceae bacterium]|nr:hypothetical protein [Oscillospiraceae bacterium]